MKFIKAFLFGTIYTLAGFAIALLFLHFTTMFYYHESAITFIQDVDQNRMQSASQYALSGDHPFLATILSNNVYYTIIAVILLYIWISNIMRKLNQNKEEK